MISCSGASRANFPSFSSVSVDCIKEIRNGKNTDVFREMDRDDIQEDCAFSVIYGDTFETLNLVAYTPDDANIWVTGLRCLVDSDKGGLLTLHTLNTQILLTLVCTSCCLHWEKEVVYQEFHQSLISSHKSPYSTSVHTLSLIFIGRKKLLIKSSIRA